MVLLVLAVIWGVLLVSWLRSRTDGGLYDSVTSFRRHLSVLARAVPVTVAPAHRLRGGPVRGARPDLYRLSTLYRQPVRRGPSPLRGYGDRSTVGAAGGLRVGRRPPSAAAVRRRQAQKRRRDVLFALFAGVLGTLLVALILRLKVIWAVQVAFDTFFFVYLALLIRIGRLASERAMRLAFVHPRHQVGRSQPAYQLSQGYGELSLRRAAN